MVSGFYSMAPVAVALHMMILGAKRGYSTLINEQFDFIFGMMQMYRYLGHDLPDNWVDHLCRLRSLVLKRWWEVDCHE